MWSPAGYHPWNEVVGRLFNITEEVLSLVAIGGKPRALVNGKPGLVNSASFYLESESFASNTDEAELIISITTCYLLSNFLQEYPPVLANLTGQFVSVDDCLLEHKDQLHLCRFGWPLKEQSEFAAMFEYAESGNFGSLELFDRFPFINANDGAICVKNGADNFLVNGVGLEEQHASELVELAGRLKGFVLCWEDFPDGTEIRNFLSYLEVDDVFTMAIEHAFGAPEEVAKPRLVATKRPRGRPSKKGPARNAYWQCFPAGHKAAGKVWKEAHAAVVEALGEPIDISTLKRAVREGRQ